MISETLLSVLCELSKVKIREGMYPRITILVAAKLNMDNTKVFYALWDILGYTVSQNVLQKFGRTVMEILRRDLYY